MTMSAARFLALVMVVVLIGGCVTEPVGGKRRPSPARPREQTCPERLHEIGGLLLWNDVVNRRLPENLADVRQFATMDQVVLLECPLSRKPYVYDRTGVPVDDPPGRAIVYDPEPSHEGKRWALVRDEGTGPLILRVRLLPEAVFAP
jgi:hypothetical protein